jgi:guanylate kinase
MNKRLILCGPAASGKDYLRKKLESRNFKYAVSYTTRPPREGEIHGKDYFFITEDRARKMIETNQFFEYVVFNGWIYGTTRSQWAQENQESVYIMTPSGISHIGAEDRNQCFIIFVDIDEDVRKTRLISRNMPGDSLERRISADSEDFKGFSNYDMRITNPNF